MHPPLVGKCPRGHDYATFGTIYICGVTHKPKRVCRECKRENHHIRKDAHAVRAKLTRHRTRCLANGHDLTVPDAYVPAYGGKRRCAKCFALEKVRGRVHRTTAAAEQRFTEQVLDLQLDVAREPMKWRREELRAQLHAMLQQGVSP